MSFSIVELVISCTELMMSLVRLSSVLYSGAATFVGFSMNSSDPQAVNPLF